MINYVIYRIPFWFIVYENSRERLATRDEIIELFKQNPDLFFNIDADGRYDLRRYIKDKDYILRCILKETFQMEADELYTKLYMLHKTLGKERFEKYIKKKLKNRLNDDEINKALSIIYEEFKEYENE